MKPRVQIGGIGFGVANAIAEKKQRFDRITWGSKYSLVVASDWSALSPQSARMV
jgi:hypothetical protein